MPIYGYACSSCDHSFDALQKMSDTKLRDCPECGEATLKKQLSAPKFRLKGQGWYETDFKTGDKRKYRRRFRENRETGSSCEGRCS